jgi:hypothetical protein
MIVHATRLGALASSPEFKPYIHGATLGRPSPTRATGVPEEAVRAAQDAAAGAGSG